MKIEALCVGTRVEVLWDITKRRRKSSVWWGAAIISIESSGLKSRSATVQYEARHGYEATVTTVCFRTERELVSIESKGKRVQHLWRCLDMGGACSIPVQPSAAGQPIASEHSRLESRQAGGEQGQYESLVLRVGELERLFQERVPINPGYSRSNETESERPLAFLRHKVGVELEKALGGSVGSVRKHAEAHEVVQQAFKVDADCTLAEFQAICQRSKDVESSAGQVHFSPSYPSRHSSRLRAKYEVFLPSYTLLCNILGVSRNEDIGATVKRARFERRSETLLLVRIIGALLKSSEQSEGGAMALAVASGLASCFNPERTVNVLYRSSCVWDPVEGYFTENLIAREMPYKELKVADNGQRECSSSDEEHADGEEIDFKITWDRTSKHTDGVFEPYNEERVLGKVCVIIPFILFKGNVLCREVNTVCSDSFIKRAIR